MANRFFRALSVLLLFAGAVFAFDNPEQKVSDLIRRAVEAKNADWAKAEIRVNFKSAENIFEQMKKYGAEAKIKIIDVFPDFKPIGNVVFPVEISEASRSQKFFVRTKVEIIKNIAVSAKLIRRGKIIEKSDLKMENRDIALIPQKYFTGQEALIGKEAKIAIPENSTVFEWMLGDIPLIKRGSQVWINVVSGGIHIKTAGEAQEDGQLNAEIRVKRRDNNKLLKGKVVSATEIEVRL